MYIPEQENLPPVEGQAAATVPALTPDGEGAGEGGKILGKFSSPEDLAKSYQELEGHVGRQSSEVGDLRKTNQVLLSQLELLQQGHPSATGWATAQQQAVEPSFDEQLGKIQEQVNSGDIDVAEALRQTASVTKQSSLSAAKEEFARMERERSARSIQDQFLKDNPDFLAAQQSGTLTQIRQQNPLHDDFSAYWAHKAQQEAVSKAEVEKSAYERGKSDVSKLAQGAEAARKVLANPGTDTRNANPPNQPMSDAQIKASMAAALSRAKGG